MQFYKAALEGKKYVKIEGFHELKKQQILEKQQLEDIELWCPDFEGNIGM